MNKYNYIMIYEWYNTKNSELIDNNPKPKTNFNIAKKQDKTTGKRIKYLTQLSGSKDLQLYTLVKHISNPI